RHTRSYGDWSSDVCSSDLCAPVARAAGCELKCITFADLVVVTAKREGVSLLIRGLRSGADFEYEMEMAGMNATMAPDVQTVFVRSEERRVGKEWRTRGGTY